MVLLRPNSDISQFGVRTPIYNHSSEPFGSGNNIHRIISVQNSDFTKMAHSQSGLGPNFLKPFGFGCFKLDLEDLNGRNMNILPQFDSSENIT